MTETVISSGDTACNDFSETALRLLNQRYFQEGEEWPDVVERLVSGVVADEDADYRDRIRAQLFNRVWLPNSPCIVNADKEGGGLFACMVAGFDEDSLENHFQVKKEIAMVAKKGGGCGFDLSVVRPEGSPVAGSAHGYAYGPLKLAESVSRDCDMMTQSGFRKMALMATMKCDHPQAYDFVMMKQTGDESHCYNFNQSLMATDEWMMSAVGSVGEEGKLFDVLTENATNNGEPGLLFYDRINNESPYSHCGCRIESSNPCGEQILPSYGSCNLGSINVSHEIFLPGGPEEGYDFNRLQEVAMDVTRFLDCVGSANSFPHQKFEDWYDDHRPVGVGVMGFANLLLELGLTYGSEEADAFLTAIMHTIYTAAKSESEALGEEKGVPSHCEKLPVPRRNITLTTVAPTGSIAILADCSHSIEPIFSPVFTRTDERGEQYTFKHPFADEDHFRSAINSDDDKVIPWKDHIDTQIAAQEWVDSGVSKTINFPSTATAEDVRDAMSYAWREGAKGITVYRAGSREKEVLEDGAEEDFDPACVDGSCDIS